MTDTHTYSPGFFNYIERGASRSAAQFAAFLFPLLQPQSVLDVGCGRGAWLKEWKASGVPFVRGLDGPYVSQASLLVSPEEFVAADLTADFDMGRKFDLVMSLEVAEHLPPDHSKAFAAKLARHGDIILFSAATPGQGGENHVNERRLSFWQEVFSELGFSAYDVIRPAMRDKQDVEPWYRYNAVLYVRHSAANRLPPLIASSKAVTALKEEGDIPWRLRRALVANLPRFAVTIIAKVNAWYRVASHRLLRRG